MKWQAIWSHWLHVVIGKVKGKDILKKTTGTFQRGTKAMTRGHWGNCLRQVSCLTLHSKRYFVRLHVIYFPCLKNLLSLKVSSLHFAVELLQTMMIVCTCLLSSMLHTESGRKGACSLVPDCYHDHPYSLIYAHAPQRHEIAKDGNCVLE